MVAGLRAARHPGRAGEAARGDPRRAAAGGEHVPALRDARGQPARAGAALEGVPTGGRPVARHRACAERQPPPARRVGPRGRPAALPHRRDRPVGRRAARRSSRTASAATSWRASPRPPTARSTARRAVPETPVGACMVSSEGTCRIWHQYGGHPDLARRAMSARSLFSTSASASSTGRADAPCGRSSRRSSWRASPGRPWTGSASARWTTEPRSGSVTAGSSSPPIPTWSTRSSSPVATSAGWPSRGR